MAARRASGSSNGRSVEAQEYRRWYSTARWRSIRAQQLASEPLCCICTAAGRITAATVCDHVEPHRGDPDRFWSGPFQSLCDAKPWRCHSSYKQKDERRGYSNQVNSEGWPVDPWHPANSGVIAKKWGYSIPHGVRPSAIHVMLVCGPPAAGKSTYVRKHAGPRDVTIDFDAIRKIVGGEKWDRRPEINAKAFAYRDRMIRGLKDKTSGTAWLIVMAPTKAERIAWIEALGAVTEVLVVPEKTTCIAQMHSDPDRRATLSIQADEIERWYRSFDGPAQGESDMEHVRNINTV